MSYCWWNWSNEAFKDIWCLCYLAHFLSGSVKQSNHKTTRDGYIKHLLRHSVFVATIFPPPHPRVVCCVCAWPTDVLQVCFYVDGWTQLRGNVSDWPIPHFFQYTPNTLKYQYITTRIHHCIGLQLHYIQRPFPNRIQFGSEKLHQKNA